MKLAAKIGLKGADCYTPTERSYVMSRIKSKGNRTTELKFIRYCRKFGLKGWRRGRRLFGRPDFVFSARKLVVFLDGDFWHGNPATYRPPTGNATYWAKKVESNRRRDRLVNRTLKKEGWKVVRIWESDLKGDCEAVFARLRLLV